MTTQDVLDLICNPNIMRIEAMQTVKREAGQG